MQQTPALPPVVEADEIAARGFLTRTELGQHFLRPSEAARRCLVRSGGPQTYGTQYRWYDGQLEMCPVADPDGLDQQGASVGLPPHHDQLVLLERRHVAAGELTSVTRERSAA